MQLNRLDEVITRLKERGIAEGRKDAEDIVAKAKQEANSIVSKAKEEAELIIARAKEDARKTRSQLDSDLRQAAQVGLEAFRQSVEKALLVPAVDESLKVSLSDHRFIEQLILEMLKAFTAAGMKSTDIEVLLSQEKKAQLENHLGLRLRGVAGGSPTLKFTDEISAGLRIGPSGREFIIDLSSDGYREIFTKFMSPRFRKLFFAKENG